MCGFVGFANQTSDAEANRRVIEAMAGRIAHRGPDQEDFYVDERVSLGFRRLSIIDLAGGSQPIFNEDRSMVLVYNGEVYNYAELRTELLAAGHVFTTQCDSEVVLHGYEEWGEAMLPRLRGMFAFVIWDANTGTIFGARDIFGIKPLFYYRDQAGTFCFGSEIKAFLEHPGFDKRLNRARLPEYLSFEYIPSNETMFTDVFKVPPASWFSYRDGELTVKPYYRFEYDIDESKTLQDWEDLIEETFHGSTVAHSIADVEVGGFLSSGVDSSYAVWELAKHNRIKTFSVGYAEQKFSELDDAEQFAAHAGVDIFTKKITSQEYFDAVPAVQYHMDEPLSNPSAVALWFLAQLASEQVKVVLSGEGADELFGGYPFYQEPLAFTAYLKLPQPIRTGLAKLASLLPPGVHGRRYLMNGALPIERRYIRNNYVFGRKERDALLRPPIPAPDPSSWTRPIFQRAQGLDEVTKMQYADLHTWLVEDILVKADRMSMAASLELRVPFLDKEMLKVALAIPTRFRVTKQQTKLALRAAAAKQLPQRNAQMRKLGFPVPLNDWLREERYYSRVLEAFSSDEAGEFFDRAKLRTMLDDHRAGHSKNMRRIWSVYCFLVWYRRYFIEEGSSAGAASTGAASTGAKAASRNT